MHNNIIMDSMRGSRWRRGLGGLVATAPLVADAVYGGEVLRDLLDGIGLGLPGALAVHFLVLLLALVHLGEVVHGLQGEVLDAEVAEGLQELSQ